MDIEFGNAGTVDTNGTGWFIGFSDWCRSTGAHLRHMPPALDARGLCVKWFMHPAGNPAGEAKPVSTGRTISMLVGGAPDSEFRIEFSPTASFAPASTVTRVLREPGDFAIWGRGLYHRAFGIAPACILTIRWEPGDAACAAEGQR
ncbi:hypothetical protein [Variovorax fucosicus]|uniref:hypothetical protein n=1 Tax=Variovorax fucosicus TaxID=3053517 RepID=UPI0025784E64|nr:hypothetical protein [Variovorax sp. J22G47]MDM0054821.1 hypothetical protein [Variovorax sp. J22G47]